MTYYRTNSTHRKSLSDSELVASYDYVFDKAKSSARFNEALLAESRELFKFNGVGEPTPKMFGVEALVCGLPFGNPVKAIASNVQNRLDKFLGVTDRYWVEPNNLACEIVVLGWPENNIDQRNRKRVVDFVKELHLPSFTIKIRGAQMHADGCVVLRGFDCGDLRSIRQTVLNQFPELPRKQSQWVHIPLGRITNQVSEDAFDHLLAELISSFDGVTCDIKISDLKFVAEKQWYMVKRETIAEVFLQE